MDYIAKHDVGLDQVNYAPGDRIRFTADQIAEFKDFQTGPVAQLLALRAIELDQPAHRPIALDQSLEQLLATAVALGLVLPEIPTPDEVIAAIEDARARLALPAAALGTGVVPTADGPKAAPVVPADTVVLEASLGMARLAEIATAEGVTYADGADAAAIIAAIEAARAGESRGLPELRANLSFAALADIAKAEGVTYAEDATRAVILGAIRASRAARTAPTV